MGIAMDDELVWLRPIVDRVKADLDELCPIFDVEGLCGTVLEGILEVDPLWFEGKKTRTIVASILYISILLGKGLRKGYLRKVLDAVGVSKPSIRDAISRFIRIDWDDGVLYLSPRLYRALSKRSSLPDYVAPYLAKEVARVKLRKTIPGLYEYLELQCTKEVGKDCISLLFENPAIFRDMVLKRYEVTIIARRIIERYLTPIVSALNIEETPRTLAELLLGNPEEFRKIILSSLSLARGSEKTSVA